MQPSPSVSDHPDTASPPSTPGSIAYPELAECGGLHPSEYFEEYQL